MGVISPHEGGIMTYKPIPQPWSGSRVTQSRVRQLCILKEKGPFVASSVVLLLYLPLMKLPEGRQALRG